METHADVSSNSLEQQKMYRVLYGLDGDMEDMMEEEVERYRIKSSLRQGRFNFLMTCSPTSISNGHSMATRSMAQNRNCFFGDATSDESEVSSIGDEHAESDDDDEMFLSENESQTTCGADSDPDFSINNNDTSDKSSISYTDSLDIWIKGWLWWILFNINIKWTVSIIVDVSKPYVCLEKKLKEGIIFVTKVCRILPDFPTGA